MSRVNAVRIHKHGGPEELRCEEVEIGNDYSEETSESDDDL